MNKPPGIKLSGRGLTVLMFSVIFTTMSILITGTILMGRAADKPLPVDVTIGNRMMPVADGSGAVMTEVVVIENNSEAEIPNLDISINKQYFLYQGTPLKEGDELVVPQAIFSTKSNQRYDCKKYPVTKIIVTGKLPSGARGVFEKKFQPAN